MSTPEAVDPLAQLAAEEAAERETQQQAQAAPPPADNAPEPAVEAQGEAVPEWKQRGFRDEQAMWKSYQELEQKFRERDNEIGELRRFQREMAQAQQQAQQPQQPMFPDGTPIWEAQAIKNAVDEGAITEFEGSMIWAEQSSRIQAMEVERRISERYAPIEQMSQRHGTQAALDALKAAVGEDMVGRHADLVGRMIKEDLPHYSDTKNGGRRLIEAVKAAELDYRENGASQPRNTNGQYASPADTFVEGGSGAQGPVTPGGTRLDPEEQHLINTLIPQHAVDEAGIKIPWAR